MRLPRSARRARTTANAPSAPAAIKSPAPRISAPAWPEPEFSGGATTPFVRATTFVGSMPFIRAAAVVAGTGTVADGTIKLVSRAGSTATGKFVGVTGAAGFAAGTEIADTTGFVNGVSGGAGAAFV